MLPQFDIYFTPLDGLAQLDIFNRLVLMDTSVAKFPEECIMFVYYHELAHILYNTPDSGRNLKTEFACDAYAGNELRRKGISRFKVLSCADMILSASPEKELRLKNLQATMI